MEELMNAVTHGVGALFSLIALVILTIYASVYGTVWHIVSFTIYGASLLLLYLASTLYHSFKDQKLKSVFKICDHMAIYLLIAGTYTPLTLIPLHGVLGWTIFAVVWGLAVIGMILQLFFVHRFKIISTICYLAMGWLVLIAIKPLMSVLSIAGLSWLLAGGIFYTVGAAFYLARRLPYHHAVWHLFVLAGSGSHFMAIFFYVLPIPVPL